MRYRPTLTQILIFASSATVAVSAVAASPRLIAIGMLFVLMAFASMAKDFVRPSSARHRLSLDRQALLGSVAGAIVVASFILVKTLW